MSDLIQIEKDDFPISVTEKAIKEMLYVREDDEDLNDSFSVRISCKGGGCAGLTLSLDFDDEVSDMDYKKEFFYKDQSIQVVVDPISAPYLKGVIVNFVRDGLVRGFKFEGGDVLKGQCSCGKSFGI